MRITFVVAAADLSGGCKVLAIHARMLRERGHELRVVVPAPWQPSVRERIRNLVRGTPLPRTTRANEGTHYDIQGVPVDVLDKDRPVTPRDVPEADVIVATWWETARWIRDFPRSRGAKAYFVQGWERYVEGQPGDEVDETFRYPFHKIVISRFLAEVARDVGGDEDVTLAPNGVDPAQFDAPRRGKQRRPTVGLVHATSHWKGTDVARAAIERVRRAVPEVRVVAFGTEAEHGPHRLPSGTEFELRPAQHRIPEIYSSADVWISASRLEGFGLPALEAMACRTPLVSTRYGGPRDFVRDGENGWLVDVGDAEALADRTLAVLREGERSWQRMSDAAHQTARSHSWHASSLAFESGLRRALEKG